MKIIWLIVLVIVVVAMAFILVNYLKSNISTAKSGSTKSPKSKIKNGKSILDVYPEVGEAVKKFGLLEVWSDFATWATYDATQMETIGYEEKLPLGDANEIIDFLAEKWGRSLWPNFDDEGLGANFILSKAMGDVMNGKITEGELVSNYTDEDGNFDHNKYQLDKEKEADQYFREHPEALEQMEREEALLKEYKAEQAELDRNYREQRDKEAAEKKEMERKNGLEVATAGYERARRNNDRRGMEYWYGQMQKYK